MLIYITAPPPTKHKNHPLPPSSCVTSSSPLAALLPHVAPALFVCLSVRLFVWLVVVSSLCPLSLLPVPLRCHATSLHCIAFLDVPLVSLLSSCPIVALLRRHILSRISLCPLCLIVASSRCISYCHGSFCLVALLVLSSLSCRCVASCSSRIVSCSVMTSLSRFG